MTFERDLNAFLKAVRCERHCHNGSLDDVQTIPKNRTDV